MPGLTKSLLIVVIVFISVAALLGGTNAEARDSKPARNVQQDTNDDGTNNEQLLTEDASVGIVPEPATLIVLIGGGVGVLITKFPRRRKIAK
jgi:hypothetical protein